MIIDIIFRLIKFEGFLCLTRIIKNAQSTAQQSHPSPKAIKYPKIPKKSKHIASKPSITRNLKQRKCDINPILDEQVNLHLPIKEHKRHRVEPGDREPKMQDSRSRAGRPSSKLQKIFKSRERKGPRTES
jgi:hypothetical protein